MHAAARTCEAIRSENAVRRATAQSRCARTFGPGEGPLSFGQERLWLLEQLDPGTGAFNVPFPLRLVGPLDEFALTRALGEIVRRHEVLRTAFVSTVSGPAQVVLDPPERVQIPVDDVSLAANPDARLEAVLEREAVASFDFAEPPLLRARLVRLAPELNVLSLVLHHIVCDGWSLDLLVQELSVLYTAFATDCPPPLAELPFQYGDYARWHRDEVARGNFDDELRFWRKHLAGTEPLELPLDRPRRAHQCFEAAAVPFSLPAPVLQRLREIGREERATPFMTFLAAFGALLAAYSSQRDVPIGTAVAGRLNPDTDRLIGVFINMIVLRLDVGGRPDFRTLVRRARETALEAYDRQSVPFEQVVAASDEERDHSRNPLFQVMFSYDTASEAHVEVHQLRIERLPPPVRRVRVDLELGLREHAQGVDGRFIYKTDLFERETIEQMARYFRRLCALCADSPDRPEPGWIAVADQERADDERNAHLRPTW